jgi:peptide/nickel transport system substrate-binding protein
MRNQWTFPDSKGHSASLRSLILSSQQPSHPTRVRVYLSLLVTLVLLAACSPGGNNNPNNSTSNVKHGGVLTVVPGLLGDVPSNFNPFPSSSSRYGARGLIYETLLFFNREDGGTHPWLATGYTFSPDTLTLTFTLRQGVNWSDGQPFTSDDVVFTLQLMHQHPALDVNGMWHTINGVSASNPNTVTVTFNQASTPNLWFLAGQTYIVPKHLWQGVTNPVTYTNPNPIGTGPFILKSFSPQVYKLGRNPGYWQQGKPYIDEVDFPSFNPSTPPQQLLSLNTVDWTGIYTPDIQQTYVSLDPVHYHYWFPPDHIVMLYLNTAKYPFDLLQVRQAISYAIDRDQLYKIGEGSYEPPASPTGLVLPANRSFLAPEYANTSFSVNVAKSISLLETAGFKKGNDGIYADKQGQRLEFKLNVVGSWNDWLTDCQIIAGELKRIGMNVTVNSLSENTYYHAMQMGTFDAVISWTKSGPTPFYLYNTLLNSIYTAPIAHQAISNWSRWSDPVTDELLNQYASTIDPSLQQQALAGIEKIMVEQVPAIPLVYGVAWSEYKTSRYTGWPDEQNPYAVPSPFSTPDIELVTLNVHLP